MTNPGVDHSSANGAVDRAVNEAGSRAAGRAVDVSVDGAVIVISLWNQGPPNGFLARLTATTPEGVRSVDVASSPDDLLEKFRIWVTTTRAIQASGR